MQKKLRIYRKDSSTSRTLETLALTDRKNLEAEIHALREPRLTQPLSGPVPSASETSEVFVVVRCGFPRKMWGLARGLMLDRHVGKFQKFHALWMYRNVWKTIAMYFKYQQSMPCACLGYLLSRKKES